MVYILKDLFKSKTVIIVFLFLMMIAYVGGKNNSQFNYKNNSNLNLLVEVK